MSNSQVLDTKNQVLDTKSAEKPSFHHEKSSLRYATCRKFKPRHEKSSFWYEKCRRNQALETKSVENSSFTHEKLLLIKITIFLERAISRSGHLTGLPVARNRRGRWNQYRQTQGEPKRSLWSRVLADFVENLAKTLISDRFVVPTGSPARSIDWSHHSPQNVAQIPEMATRAPGSELKRSRRIDPYSQSVGLEKLINKWIPRAGEPAGAAKRSRKPGFWSDFRQDQPELGSRGSVRALPRSVDIGFTTRVGFWPRGGPLNGQISRSPAPEKYVFYET